MKILLFIGLIVTCMVGLAYLTRTRGRVSRQPARQLDLMDSVQARAVLGLENGTIDVTQVIDAHRRLMQRVHPDKGGSALLAQQLNEAKRVLLIELS